MQKLSNQELELNLKRLVANERKILHLILEHVIEVDSRKLYLEKAYPSLFEYLVHECGYSGAGAMRRISAARLMKQVPVVREKIQRGDLNLSQISELSRAIKEKEKSGSVVSTLKKAELVESIAGKTTRDSQKDIAQILDLDLKAPEKTLVQKDDSVHLQITFTQEQYQKLLACRDAAAHVLLSEKQDVSLASVVEFLSDVYLEAKKVSFKARSKSQSAKAPQEASSQNTATKHAENKTLTPKNQWTLLQRDGWCQYKDKRTGEICGSTFNLETDHIRSRWAGGGHGLENLQTLCRAHNNFKYQREMNVKFK